MSHEMKKLLEAMSGKNPLGAPRPLHEGGGAPDFYMTPEIQAAIEAFAEVYAKADRAAMAYEREEDPETFDYDSEETIVEAIIEQMRYGNDVFTELARVIASKIMKLGLLPNPPEE